MANSNSKTFVILALIVLVAIIAWAALSGPDKRSTGDRVSDAVEQLPNGVDNAAGELKDRTPGQKVGDAVEDAGEKIKEQTR